jgi:hypothetical protein
LVFSLLFVSVLAATFLMSYPQAYNPKNMDYQQEQHFAFTQWDSEKRISLVNVFSILTTKPIMNAAKQAGFNNTSGLTFKIQPGEQGFGLSRTQSVIDAMNSKIILPPVILKMFKEINGTMYYEIIDGRHRIAISLAMGYTQIPAIIL